MKRYGRAVAIAWLVATACGDDGGCRIEQEALIVLHSVPPTEDCGYDAGSDLYLTDGIYDVGGRTGYVLAPVLKNNLVAMSAEGSNTGVEAGELQLEPDVDVSIHLPADVVDRLPAGVPRSFTNYVATDSLDPGELYVTTIDLLSPELIEALPGAIDPGDLVVARVDIRFHVTRTGNSKGEAGVIDARDYSFPLDLCHGCLVTGCECDDPLDPMACIPGTEIYATRCGRTQDPQEDVAFACLVEESTGPADSSSGSPADSSGSSSG